MLHRLTDTAEATVVHGTQGLGRVTDTRLVAGTHTLSRARVLHALVAREALEEVRALHSIRGPAELAGSTGTDTQGILREASVALVVARRGTADTNGRRVVLVEVSGEARVAEDTGGATALRVVGTRVTRLLVHTGTGSVTGRTGVTATLTGLVVDVAVVTQFGRLRRNKVIEGTRVRGSRTSHVSARHVLLHVHGGIVRTLGDAVRVRVTVTLRVVRVPLARRTVPPSARLVTPLRAERLPARRLGLVLVAHLVARVGVRHRRQGVTRLAAVEVTTRLLGIQSDVSSRFFRVRADAELIGRRRLTPSECRTSTRVVAAVAVAGSRVATGAPPVQDGRARDGGAARSQGVRVADVREIEATER